jgi:hypothetical protein
MTGRHLRIGPAGLVDGQLQLEIGGDRGGIVERAADQVRDRDIAGTDRDPGSHHREDDKGGGKRANEQQELACSPHPRRDGHR